MSRIILDMGSGNTCRNRYDIAKRMVDVVADSDSRKHEVIFKWQLFFDEPPNKPLHHTLFAGIYAYAEHRGYRTTSSVFDEASLKFLLDFDIPFVKLACREHVYPLHKLVPRRLPIYVSLKPGSFAALHLMHHDVSLCCIPQYPAKLEDYPTGRHNYSDHVEGLGLWEREAPEIWEKHFVLKKDDPDNPDAAGHAIGPEELRQIL